jgi:hypothetical protein
MRALRAQRKAAAEESASDPLRVPRLKRLLSKAFIKAVPEARALHKLP